MKNNWPETVDELIEECENLIGRDLYTLGERGEPYAGEDEPRVDGTDYLAGEYQYGVMMIPVQWVTNVISSNALVTGTCHMRLAYEEEDADGCIWPDHYECDVCGAKVNGIMPYYDTEVPPHFCPNCGRRVVAE